MSLPKLTTMFSKLREGDQEAIRSIKAKVNERLDGIDVEYDAVLVFDGRTMTSMSGFIFNDKKGRFDDGTPVVTSRIISQSPVRKSIILLETRNSKYLLMH